MPAALSTQIGRRTPHISSRYHDTYASELKRALLFFGPLPVKSRRRARFLLQLMACVFWFWRPQPAPIDRSAPYTVESTHYHRIIMPKGACLEPRAAELEAHSAGRVKHSGPYPRRQGATSTRRRAPSRQPAAPRLSYSAQAPSAVMGGVDQPAPAAGPQTAIPERPSMPPASQNSINPRPLPPAAAATSGAGKQQGGIWSQLKIEVRGAD